MMAGVAVQAEDGVGLLTLCLFLVLLTTAVNAAVLEIEQPAADLTDEAIQPLEVGLTEPVANLTYSLNGLFKGTCECVHERQPLRLVEGENTVTVRAEAPDGTEQYTAETEVRRDTEPPTVQVLEPNETIYRHGGRLRVRLRDASGIVRDRVRAMIDGRRVNGTVKGRLYEGRFDDLQVGEHRLTVTVSDELGNRQRLVEPFRVAAGYRTLRPSPTGTLTSRVVRPKVTLRSISPIDVDRWRLAVVGISSRTYNYNRYLAGDELAAVPHGTAGDRRLQGTRLRVPSDGSYAVQVQRRTGEGFSTEARWRFHVDTRAPIPDIVSPDTMQGNATVAVELASADETALAELRVGGRTVRDRGGVTTSIDTTSLRDGVRQVTVAAEDRWGNRRVETVAIRVDNDAPQIERLRVFPDHPSDALRIAGRARDRGSRLSNVSYTVWPGRVRGTIPVTGTWFNGTIDLAGRPPGRQVIGLDVRDASGNTRRRNITVVRTRGTGTDVAVEAPGMNASLGRDSVAIRYLRLDNRGGRNYVSLTVESPMNVSTVDGVSLQRNETRFIPLYIHTGNRTGEFPITIRAEGLGSVAVLERQVDVEQRGTTVSPAGALVRRSNWDVWAGVGIGGVLLVVAGWLIVRREDLDDGSWEGWSEKDWDTAS